MSYIFTNKSCLTCAYWSGIRKVDGTRVSCAAGQRGMCAFHQTETKDNDKCGDYVILIDESKAKRNLKYKNQTKKSSRNSGKKDSKFNQVIGFIFLFAIIAAVSGILKTCSKSDSSDSDIPDMVAVLKQSIENNVEVSDKAGSFILNNEKLFQGNAKLKAVNKKVEDSVSVSKYCKNADSYKDKFIYLKNVEINRTYQSRNMYVVDVYYDESDFIHHHLYVYFYYDVGNLDYEDQADIYAYSMTKETDFVDENMPDDIESGEYSEYLIGSYIKKRDK